MGRDSKLLPPDASGMLTSVPGFLGNVTPHPVESVFNFSLEEAIEILREHQRSEKVLVAETEIAIVVVYSVLMTSGVVSNALVCFVVGRQCARKRHQSGPTPRNLYIVNLAVADLALCLVCMPFTLVSLLKRRWTLGLLLCKLVPVLQGGNIMVSAGTITAIAFDRYFTIVHTENRRWCRTAHCSVATTIAVIWCISFATMAPLLIYLEVETVRIGGLVVYEACVERWPSPRAQAAYTLGLSVLQFAIPVLVLSTVHTRISTYLSIHLAQAPADNSCKRAKRECRRNRRTMAILSCIAIVFALSWLPMTAFTLVLEFHPGAVRSAETLYMVFSVCHIAAMSTAVTNPLLYGWLNTNFRRELRAMGGGDSGERRRVTERSMVTRNDRRISTTCFTTVTASSQARPTFSALLHPPPPAATV